MPANVEVCCLCKNYDRIRAVDNVSFKAGEGEVIALLGPNGAGKSTLMNMMAGYLAPSVGEVFICGRKRWTSSCGSPAGAFLTSWACRTGWAAGGKPWRRRDAPRLLWQIFFYIFRKLKVQSVGADKPCRRPRGVRQRPFADAGGAS